jgi:hypothetical protein
MPGMVMMKGEGTTLSWSFAGYLICPRNRIL